MKKTLKISKQNFDKTSMKKDGNSLELREE